MPLTTYRKKRDFRKTPEPKGGGRAARRRTRLAYVIQKHAASHLHYDFRLELDGVLKSWAVPKGPSLNPADKRLAVEVEDHPVEYGGFEGTIPKGEYGGGSVLLWDRGTWEPVGDAHEGLRQGRLSFDLFGEKLKGTWHLIRMKGRDEDRKPTWLLFKEKDAESRARGDVLRDRPESVKTGRAIEEVGKNGKVWHSDRPSARERPAPPPKPTRKGPPKRDPGRKAPLRDPPPEEPKHPPVREPPDEAREATVAGVAITHPKRVLFPEAGITKRDLASYIEAVAERMLPHVKGRPLMLVRCPEGRTGGCFFQKHPGFSVPRSVRQITVRESKGNATYLAVSNVAGLVGLIQVGVIEIHIWGAREDRQDSPDRLVFDLDPDPSVPWSRTVHAALDLRERLRALGLESFPKTTGGKGLHVVAPFRRGPSWDDVARVGSAVAASMIQDDPDGFTATLSKAKRRGKILIDTLRNRRGATWVAPYSPRAREGAPVSMPLAWNEVTPALRPSRFTVRTAASRLRKKDPWGALPGVRQSLPRVRL
ncbi:MAG TPA: non-homologous end-joining DNA ligase [Candidatus Eisenbacteria bacterium]|nr:non-homologous end-joining DNA ligase [Candidatus Eisenbacteria bacterium]